MSETNCRHFLYWFDILRLLVRFELNNRTNEDKKQHIITIYIAVFLSVIIRCLYLCIVQFYNMNIV